MDRDQVLSITDRAVTCDLDDEQAAGLPAPSGPGAYDADAFEDTGSSLVDRYNRLFLRGRWKPEKN